MDILPPIQATLNFVGFMANLIDLKQFSTILVLYDRTTRNEINFVIETLPTSYDIAWLLLNQDKSPEYWEKFIMRNRNMLIFTAFRSNTINTRLKQLYDKKHLSKRSKNLIVTRDIGKSANEILSPLIRREINAILVDWTSEESEILAWNPYGPMNMVRLNVTEFLHTSIAADSATGRYPGLFFDQLQNMRGKSLNVFGCYDSKNLYNVVTKDSIASVDGTEIQIIELIGEAIQSSMSFYVDKTIFQNLKIDPKLIEGVLLRSYRIYTPIQRRRIQDFTLAKW